VEHALQHMAVNKTFWEEFASFPYISHLFEVREPNLMELNLSELTLTSFSSILLNLTECTSVNNLVAMVTMVHKQSKPTVSEGSPNNFEPQ
jgi:hypothetical protein